MAWTFAGYAAAIALLTVAGCTAAATWELCSRLRKWDRMAARLAEKFDRTIDDYGVLAREVRQLAEECRRAMEGVTRLAEGARAVGQAAEDAAKTVVSTIDAWRHRITAWIPAGENSDVSLSAWVEGVAAWWSQRMIKGVHHPGTNANPESKE